MRVIAGSARGRRLKTPKGTSVRPTSDKVRGAIFSILTSQRDLVDASVLDLFAGTGALGIEALSRGAARAVFVEKDTRTAALVTENLVLTGFDSSAKVIRADADKLDLASLGRFDLVFADPPYALVLTSRALARIGEVIADGGLAIVEHAIDAPPPTPSGLEAFDRREYGDTCITFYRRGS
jgi:16S rRNA (guanine966-N2)-methyltransferase